MKILLADDDRSLRRVLQFKLEQAGYDVVAVEDGQAALKQLEKDLFDLVLSDIKMPRMDGLELLEKAGIVQPGIKVVLLTAHATVSQAVQAVKLGAFDYITKPFEDDELMLTIEKALAFRKLEDENRRLKGRLQHESGTPRLLGISRPFKEMMALVSKIAATDATVLITGASGTGKELVARTLHNQSTRSGGEFVAVNCAAIPRDLIESELFGHVKGAFTGAVRDKKGKFELATDGTLFLDEVGDLALDLQAKLLRALQEKFIEPVGGERQREVDVRVVTATNVNLQQWITEGKFREDLYYRLNVIPIKIPSLTERREDIPMLANAFVKQFAPKNGIELSEPLVEALLRHSWPGNIRELENLIERLVVLRKSDTLTVNDLPEDFGRFDPRRDKPDPELTGEHVTFREAEEQLVRNALARCGWNRTKAASYLNIPRHVLIYRLKKYAIVPPE